MMEDSLNDQKLKERNDRIQKLRSISKRDLILTINRLYDSYKLLLRKGLILDAEIAERSQFFAACANINDACNVLLDKIHQVRLHRLLQSNDDKDNDDYNENDDDENRKNCSRQTFCNN